MTMNAEARQQFEREERAYWQQRDELLKQYAGKWVAIVDGQVVAVGDQMNKVAAKALHKTGRGLMYVNLVGREDIVLRVRQVESGRYDRSYTPPMPMITASVSDVLLSKSVDVNFVVDTGADLTLLRSDVADQADVWSDVAGHLQVGGIGGAAVARSVGAASLSPWLLPPGVAGVADCLVPAQAVLERSRTKSR